jgi:hypothetical protein
MFLAQQLMGESFRALRPEKLGKAVLNLCRERNDSKRTEQENEANRGEHDD